MCDFSPLPHGYSGSSGSQCGLIGELGGLKTHKQQGDLLWPEEAQSLLHKELLSQYHTPWPIIIATSSESLLGIQSSLSMFPLNFSCLFLVLPCCLLKTTWRSSESFDLPYPHLLGLGKISPTGLCCEMRKLNRHFLSPLGLGFGVTFQAFPPPLLLISKHSLPAKLTVRAPDTRPSSTKCLCSCSSLCPELYRLSRSPHMLQGP